MWGSSWGLWLTALAAAFGIVAMGFAFAGGGVIVAIPLAFLIVIGAGLLDMRRRRRQVQEVRSHRESAKAEGVDFTERDKETLVSE